MKRAVIVATVIVATGFAVVQSNAQRVDPRRPSVFVVGPPTGAAPMHRVDARRSGESTTPLPRGALRIAWQKAIAGAFDQPALGSEPGIAAVVSTRGDVTFLDEQGEEKTTVKVGASQVGPAAATSDGTIVYVSGSGDAIGIRRSSVHPRFTSRIGGKPIPAAAPLALDDGGVVLATSGVERHDLVLLDADGNVRARTSLPERPAHPLLAARDRILAVTASGAVFAWTPGGPPSRIGSFGGPVDGGAVLTEGKLLGVIDGHQLAEVDLATGGRTIRATAAQGLYLGPPAVVGPPGSRVSLLGLTLTRGYAVTVDASGQELVRAPIATYVPAALADGGAPPLVAPFHTGPLVDARGTIAFSGTDGQIGVVSPEGAVDALGEPLCMKTARTGVLGLTPFGAGAFLATCDGGLVAKVVTAGSPSSAAPRN